MLEYQDEARYTRTGYRYYRREGTGHGTDKYRLPKHWCNPDKFPRTEGALVDALGLKRQPHTAYRTHHVKRFTDTHALTSIHAHVHTYIYIYTFAYK